MKEQSCRIPTLTRRQRSFFHNIGESVTVIESSGLKRIGAVAIRIGGAWCVVIDSDTAGDERDTLLMRAALSIEKGMGTAILRETNRGLAPAKVAL